MIMNHEWTPMDANIRHLSTEHTEETECLADVGQDAEDFCLDMVFMDCSRSDWPPSARRFPYASREAEKESS